MWHKTFDALRSKMSDFASIKNNDKPLTVYEAELLNVVFAMIANSKSLLLNNKVIFHFSCTKQGEKLVTKNINSLSAPASELYPFALDAMCELLGLDNAELKAMMNSNEKHSIDATYIIEKVKEEIDAMSSGDELTIAQFIQNVSVDNFIAAAEENALETAAKL